MSEDTRGTLPLDEVMLAMDVVDTLRHRQDLVERELNEDQRAATLIGKLRDIYADQGIDVPDHILKEGVDALAESRFVYTPPRGGLRTALARLYVSRGRWGAALVAIVVAIGLVLAAYQFAYRPFVASQQVALEERLSEELPAQMDAIYATVYRETKVQEAVRQAEEIRTRGKSAAAAGELERAEAAVFELGELRDLLRLEYRLTIVNRPGVRTGVSTSPDDILEATNRYLVVEALSPDNDVLKLPILNEESGEIEDVDMFAIRVPENVYEAVARDKQDDGIVQQNIVGVKQFGYLDVDYVVPVLGGAITRW